MWKLTGNIVRHSRTRSELLATTRKAAVAERSQQTAAGAQQLPASADVVIIGGGSAGCHTLYHLAKRGVKAVLLERAKLTAGTTWHTAGLVWRLRPNDVDIQVLANSRNMLMQLEEETGLDPGWIQNGGVFIAHSDVRLDEYKRLSTVGNALGIENYILTPEETQKVFPLLDPKAFVGALYSPGDGVVDPAMLCTALTRAAGKNGGQVVEECSVEDLLVEQTPKGPKIVGVSTSLGNIKTDTVVNATGVWGRDLVEKHGSYLPLVPMKHAYIVSESIPGVRGLPNIRDHDYSTYFRIQGDAICMGGYETNPILMDRIPKDFHFGLYDLDWTVFETHLNGAVKLCPTYGQFGVKSTVCGPESFTPDHKPLMGPDPKVNGLFHNCGFNSAGMMFGGGCGEQIAQWIVNGQPDLPMFGFDLRRFTADQCRATQWINEKSHESYAKNYSMVFKYDQPLSGRDFQKDPLHDDMLQHNAFMEEKQGWERPGFFLKQDKAEVLPYDWYGNYGHKRHENSSYERVLEGDLKYSVFSDHHNLIGEEALACRNNAVVFNMSYFCKLFLEGPDAQKAADWIFTANTNLDTTKKTIYTCALNDRGGVEADVTISRLNSGSGSIHDPKFDGQGYYIVAGGASAYYTYTQILSEIRNKGFNATVRDVTADMGVISIQGPKSREILQHIVDCDLSNENIPPNNTVLANALDEQGSKLGVRLLRVSFVGELGFELHVPKEYCSRVYRSLMKAGATNDLRNAGYRALYSLSSEKGYHLWSFDLRPDDTPLEAGLGFTCRKTGEFKGKDAVAAQRKEGLRKRLVYLTLNEQMPLWGLEGVYRNGEPVGILRRAEYAYTLGKPFSQAYLQRPDGQPINTEYIKSGDYEIDVLGKRYKADCHLRSPFDPEGKRVLGVYE